MQHPLLKLKPAAFAVLAALTPLTGQAANDLDELRRTVEMLQQQLEQVQKQLREQEQRATPQARADAGPETPVTREELDALRKEVATASEWRSPNTLIHMAGYSSISYEKTQGNNDDGSFQVGQFAPIFHFQYRDLVMLESELEFQVKDDGETETSLEYLTIDWFMNDYATLVAGKFMSPIGQFRQNLHPSWINKMASAPPGFGHDGAAPVSDLGVQVRGGYPLGGIRTNYALFVSNGPELVASFENGDYELESVDAEGFNKDSDGSKVFGGRIGILPVRGLEIGLSGATGKASVTKLEQTDPNNPDPDLSNEDKRDYDVYGADFNFQYRSLGMRGEYVRTRVGSSNRGLTASGNGNWETWYTQAAYRFLPTHLEAVLRYADYDSEVDSMDQKQWAVGLNYLFTSNFIAKVNYEFNDGNDNSSRDDNRILGQLAYGF